METRYTLPRWVSWLCAVSWGLYAAGIVLFSVGVYHVITAQDLQMIVVRGLFGGPPDWLILLIDTLCVLALIIFSLLPYTSVNSLVRHYRLGGGAAVRKAGMFIWTLAVVGQIVAWGLLAILILLGLRLFSLEGIYQSMAQHAPEVLLTAIMVIMALGPVMLLSFLFVPATPLIGALVFLFRAAHQDGDNC